MAGILLVVFAIINWVIYHKIFVVFYFGNKSKSIMNEIIWCLLIACFETALVMVLGQWALGIIFAILMIIGICLALKEMVKTFKEVKDTLVKKDKNEKTESVVNVEETSSVIEDSDIEADEVKASDTETKKAEDVKTEAVSVPVSDVENKESNNKVPWYLSGVFIAILFLASFVLGFTWIVAIVLIVVRVKKFGKKKVE